MHWGREEAVAMHWKEWEGGVAMHWKEWEGGVAMHWKGWEGGVAMHWGRRGHNSFGRIGGKGY